MVEVHCGQLAAITDGGCARCETKKMIKTTVRTECYNQVLSTAQAIPKCTIKNWHDSSKKRLCVIGGSVSVNPSVNTSKSNQISIISEELANQVMVS